MTTQECLLHYFRSQNKDRHGGNKKLYEKVAKFCKVNPNAPKDWVRKYFLPRGLILVRLRIFLVEQGYEVDDLGLHEDAYKFASMMAHDVISTEEAVKHIGITRDHLSQNLLGSRPASEQTLARMRRVMKEHETPTNQTVPAKAVKSKSVPTDLKLLQMQTVAGVIKTVLPTVMYLSSDTTDPEDRKRFREMVGDENLYLFSVHIHQLAGEIARRRIREGQ